MATKKTEPHLTIDPLKRGKAVLRIVGETPLIFNSMSAKAMRTLLVGGAKKTAAERKELKHDPDQEFEDSIYRLPEGAETLLGFPAPGIKAAMATSALVTPGVTKRDVERMLFVPVEMVPIWGIPYQRCDVVRSADINRTPDVRTRAILREWCSEVELRFIEPNLNLNSIMNLLANAGIVAGIGDFRQEKGAGSYGTFRVVPEGDEDWHRIKDASPRQAQVDAMEDPQPYNDVTRDLLAFYDNEKLKRGQS